MNVYDPAALAAAAVATRPERPATAIVHDAAGARLVLFRIEAGQAVAPHTSASTVILSVVAGAGLVSGPDGERPVRAGDVVAYAPDERHGMRALSETLVVLATIAPRPGGGA
ncbi:MAG TPA: AraC family ligand binding domain-containing protein [Gemmatimonadaceae bacterium]|nr:AraC family ligand binding domain-containing protein [Gemmatimonadaceae bacterium]